MLHNRETFQSSDDRRRADAGEPGKCSSSWRAAAARAAGAARLRASDDRRRSPTCNYAIALLIALHLHPADLSAQPAARNAGPAARRTSRWVTWRPAVTCGAAAARSTRTAGCASKRTRSFTPTASPGEHGVVVVPRASRGGRPRRRRRAARAASTLRHRPDRARDRQGRGRTGEPPLAQRSASCAKNWASRRALGRARACAYEIPSIVSGRSRSFSRASITRGGRATRGRRDDRGVADAVLAGAAAPPARGGLDDAITGDRAAARPRNASKMKPVSTNGH